MVFHNFLKTSGLNHHFKLFPALVNGVMRHFASPAKG